MKNNLTVRSKEEMAKVIVDLVASGVACIFIGSYITALLPVGGCSFSARRSTAAGGG